MLLIINYYTVALFLGGIIAFLSGLFVFLANKKNILSISWLLLNICSSVWSFGYLYMIISVSEHVAYISNVVLHIAASFIPFFFLLFISNVTKTYLVYKKIIWFFISPITLFFVYIANSSLFVTGVFHKFVFNYAPNAGPLYIFFALYFALLTMLSLFILFKRIIYLDRHKESLQLRQILISSSFGFLGGGSVFFLTFNINFPPYPIILFALFPLVIVRAILKYNLFNVKVIATEMATFLMFILFFTRFVLSENQRDYIINGGFFITTILLGFFLIKSVKKESQVNDEMKRKNKELFRLNARLIELDKHKDDFVSIAAHQLRTPAGVIRNYVGMIKTGLYGEFPEKLNDPVGRIYDNAVLLAETVSSILDISRIESGKTKVEFKKNNIEELLKSIVSEQEANAKKKNLTLDLEVKEGLNYDIVFDHEKLDHMLANLIDNSIKYTEKGGVKVKLYGNEFFILVDVADTGRGMSKKFIETQLYQKFAREEEVVNNISGNGLGMYFVKEVVELHKGKISVVSEWGKGSTFTVAVPTKLKEENVEVFIKEEGKIK